MGGCRSEPWPCPGQPTCRSSWPLSSSPPGSSSSRFGRGAPTVGAAGWSEWRHTLAIVGTCAFVALAIERLGYRSTIVIACAFLIGVVERRHPVAAALVAIGLATGTYYLFDTLLRVQLPRGPFGL